MFFSAPQWARRSRWHRAKEFTRPSAPLKILKWGCARAGRRRRMLHSWNLPRSTALKRRRRNVNKNGIARRFVMLRRTCRRLSPTKRCQVGMKPASVKSTENKMWNLKCRQKIFPARTFRWRLTVVEFKSRCDFITDLLYENSSLIYFSIFLHNRVTFFFSDDDNVEELRAPTIG